MVQSGSLALIVPDASLEGRSASMLLALLTIHVTTCAATMYVAYISQWSEVRVWLQRKANSATARQQSPACPIHIDGVSLSRSQLLHMTDSTAAKVLLDCRGLWGWLSMLLMQGGMLNLVCLGSLLVSQVLALHVGPRMLLQELVALYYPVLPELEGGMCSLDGAPQFPGMLGRFLVFLAGV
jgi:hypothetical protein